jgi:hypothetical protein
MSNQSTRSRPRKPPRRPKEIFTAVCAFEFVFNRAGARRILAKLNPQTSGAREIGEALKKGLADPEAEYIRLTISKAAPAGLVLKAYRALQQGFDAQNIVAVEKLTPSKAGGRQP